MRGERSLGEEKPGRLKEAVDVLEFMLFPKRVFSRSSKNLFGVFLEGFEKTEGLVTEMRGQLSQTKRGSKEYRDLLERMKMIINQMPFDLDMAEKELSNIEGWSKRGLQEKLDAARRRYDVLRETVNHEEMRNLPAFTVDESQTITILRPPLPPARGSGAKSVSHAAPSNHPLSGKGICECGCVLPQSSMSCPNCGRNS